jgi:hypothetical protein
VPPLVHDDESDEQHQTYDQKKNRHHV